MKSVSIACAAFAGFLFLLSPVFVPPLPLNQGSWYTMAAAGVMALLAIATRSER